MQKGLIRKGLVFSVIVLFIGVCVQSAFAVENRTSIVNNKSEEDCIECQVSGRYSFLRVNFLYIKSKVIINIASLIIDEDEITKELLKENTKLSMITFKLTPYSQYVNSPPLILCGMFLTASATCLAIGASFANLAEQYIDSPILYNILQSTALLFGSYYIYFADLFTEYCITNP